MSWGDWGKDLRPPDKGVAVVESDNAAVQPYGERAPSFDDTYSMPFLATLVFFFDDPVGHISVANLPILVSGRGAGGNKSCKSFVIKTKGWKRKNPQLAVLLLGGETV